MKSVKCVQLVMVLAIGVGLWGEARARAQNRVYDKVAPSTVAFVSDNGQRVKGTGVVIDAKQRLVLTANHVVQLPGRKNPRVKVLFPRLEGKEVLTDLKRYRTSGHALDATSGAVVLYDYLRDLALVQMDSMPAGITEIALSQKNPRPGDTVHVIGNSTGQWGAIFGYNKGHVRNNYYWHAPQTDLCFFALAHHSPTNKGDSGGPVVNDNGELVAIVSEGTIGDSSRQGSWTYLQQVIDNSVHVQEIRDTVARWKKEGFQVPSSVTLRTKVANLVHFPAAGDLVFLPVKAKEPVEIKLTGQDGTNDLDLSVDLGNPDSPFDKANRASDKETLTLTPDWDGMCFLRVKTLPLPAEHTEYNDIVKRLGDKELPEEAKRKLSNRLTEILVKENKYELNLSWKNGSPGATSFMRKIIRDSTDEFRFHYQAGKGKVRLRLIGDEDTDLDLVVKDPQGKDVKSGTGYSDREEVIFDPEATGVYTVEVKNLGNVWNRYVLMVD